MNSSIKNSMVVTAFFLAVAFWGSRSDAQELESLQISFARFSPQEYVRPYGPNAPWNIPVKGIAKHPESDLWVDRLWRLSTAHHPGNFNLGGFDDYSYPVYVADEATIQAPVKSRHPDWGNLHGQCVPWNPAWKPAKGSDGQVIILDPRTGREWNLWQVKFDGKTLFVGNGNLVDGDYRTKEDGFRSSRGCGIQYLAMLTRPEEIMQGAIRHALSMPTKNPNSNLFLPPATKTDGDNFGIPEGVPEGMRFALNVTDEEIETWIEGLPTEIGELTRYSARVIAVALRDYGWIITDNSGGAFFQFESNETAGEKWKALGLDKREICGKQYPRDLLDGLLTKERIYAVVPSDQYPNTIRDHELNAEQSAPVDADKPRHGALAFDQMKSGGRSNEAQCSAVGIESHPSATANSRMTAASFCGGMVVRQAAE